MFGRWPFFQKLLLLELSLFEGHCPAAGWVLSVSFFAQLWGFASFISALTVLFIFSKKKKKIIENIYFGEYFLLQISGQVPGISPNRSQSIRCLICLFGRFSVQDCIVTFCMVPYSSLFFFFLRYLIGICSVTHNTLILEIERRWKHFFCAYVNHCSAVLYRQLTICSKILYPFFFL